MKKQVFTVHTLSLMDRELIYTSRTFEADHYLPNDPTETYRADEFAQIVHNKNPYGVYEQERTIKAADIDRVTSTTYVYVEHGVAAAHKISLGDHSDKNGFIYGLLLESIKMELEMKRIDVDEQISRLRLKQDQYKIMRQRAIAAREPKLNGGDK